MPELASGETAPGFGNIANCDATELSQLFVVVFYTIPVRKAARFITNNTRSDSGID